MKNTKKAFHWIVGALEKHNVTYKILGGFAARIYGVNRELADIDIQMAEADIRKIVEDVRPYITFGPARYKGRHWELDLLTLEYEGQEIDIGGVEAQILNKETGRWEKCPGDLETVEYREVFDRRVPIESRESLIAYKSKLARDVDVEDVRQLMALKT